MCSKLTDKNRVLKVYNNPGKLYRSLDSIIKSRINEYCLIGNKEYNVHVLIYGDIYDVNGNKVENMLIVDTYLHKTILDDETMYEFYLDIIYKDIIKKYCVYNSNGNLCLNILNLYDDDENVSKNHDNIDVYSRAYMEVISTMICKVTNEVLFESICEKTFQFIIHRLDENLKDIKMKETWIPNFAWVMDIVKDDWCIKLELSEGILDESIHIGIKMDRYAGKLNIWKF